MKSSESYTNRQASPKVVFVPNWSDFRLDCQFMLHVFQRLHHCHIWSPREGLGNRPPQCVLLTPCQAISSRVTWRARHQHSQDKPLTLWGLTENWENLGTEKVLKVTLRHTVTLLTLRGRWVNCSLSWWARLTRKSIPFRGLISSPELEWKTHLTVCQAFSHHFGYFKSCQEKAVAPVVCLPAYQATPSGVESQP